MKYNKSLVLFMIFTVITCISIVGSASAADTGNNTTINDTNTTNTAIDTNTTGQSKYKGPQTNTTKWSNTDIPDAGGSVVVTKNGTVYDLSYSGHLYAISPKGTTLWNLNLNKALWGIDYDYYSTLGSPAVGKDGTIYVSISKFLVAVNPNGTVKWNYTTGANSGTTYSSPVIGPDGTIYFINGENLYAIDPTLPDPNNEDAKWHKYLNVPKGGLALSPDGKVIYVGSHGTQLLYAINTTDGSEIWARSIGDTQCTPVVGPDGTIYMVGDKFYAFNPDGSGKWNCTLSGSSSMGIVIASDGTIYVGTSSGLYALDPTNSANHIKWSQPIGSITYATGLTVGSDGTIYAITDDGMLYALNFKGDTIWKSNLGGEGGVTPVIYPDGTLYAGSYETGIFTFQDLIANLTTTLGANPLNCTFTDTSSNIPTQWSWKFGDGNTSTDQNPTHKYANPGTYTVTLTVTTANGDTNTTTQTITVNKDITAPTATTKPNGTYNNPNITLTSSDDFDQNPTLYYSLDNGVTWHTAAKTTTLNLADGTYTVQYYAEDATGNKGATQTATYTIDTKAPTASANIVSGTYNTNKVVTIIMNENGNIYYTLNGATPTTSSTRYTGPITISSTKTLKYIAVDASGNSSPVYTATYNIDKIAPKISATTPKNQAGSV